jgi:hypothetical protein
VGGSSNLASPAMTVSINYQVSPLNNVESLVAIPSA